MTAAIALVGAGPRAVAVTARLVADHRVLTPGTPLVVHLIDAVDVGAGRTWRRDQHPLLLNNTYCAETTVFADETVPTLGPVEAGPSLAEWARDVAAAPVGVQVTAEGFRASTAVPGQQWTAVTRAEARMTLGDLRSTDDPLVRSMVDTGQARFHRVRGRDREIETSTLDVAGDGFLLIDASGRPHPRRVVVGSAAGDVQWYAAIGAIPNTADKFLVGAERVAAYALRVVGGRPARCTGWG